MPGGARSARARRALVPTASASNLRQRPKRRDQPRRDLRIELVGGDDHVGEQRIAAARRVVERPLIGAERAGQRAQAVGIGEGEIGMVDQSLDRSDRIAAAAPPPAARTICRAPADRRGSARKMPPAPPRARARRATPKCRARPGGRSYCRRASNCALASLAPSSGSPAAISPSATLRRRRTPLAVGDRSLPRPGWRNAQPSNCSPSASPIAARSPSRAS